jgi:hypothetical protein
MKIKVDVVDGKYTFEVPARHKRNPKSHKTVMDVDIEEPKKKKKKKRPEKR